MYRHTALILLVWLYLVGLAMGQSLPTNTITIFDTSGKTQTNRPVSISRVFRQGDILNFVRASVDAAPVLTQTDMKNRWPDGSLKFAIISFVIPTLPANGSVTVAFSSQSTGNNNGYLTQMQMIDPAYDFDGTIQMTGATTQTVSAQAMLQSGHYRYWLQGPIVTAIILEDRSLVRTYDKDFGDGSKALHPIFEAWFYPQISTVQLGYTMENTWASTDPAKSMQDLTYSLTLKSGLTSPITKFTHPAFAHIGRSRWYKEFWLGTGPGSIRINHNIKYLVSTKAIPNYDTGITIAESLISSKYSAWRNADKTLDGDSLGIGNYEKALSSAGASDWIGLMNTWDTIYLLTMDDRMKEMMLGNANLAGRMPIHFREADASAGTGKFFDEVGTVATFGRTVSINARKQVTLSDLSVTCSGMGADKINTGAITDDGWGIVQRDHMPDVAYMPYLMTGRYYYLEELQYWSSYVVGYRPGCYGTDYTRQGEAGYLNDSQLRGDAWGFRTLAYGAFLSPDGSPEKAYYEEKMVNNIAEWEGIFNLPLSDGTNQIHWTWGRNMRSRNPTILGEYGISPLGAWYLRGSGFVQAPLKTDGSLLAAASPWEENFLVAALGMAKHFGYATNALLHFLARMRLNILLNQATIPYLIESYRYPTIVAATNNWVSSWADFAKYYATVPTTWSVDSTADHGYGFIALAALSFLSDQSVDGYTGQQAWNFYNTNKLGKDRFATESPKWAILPRTEFIPPPTDTTPPSPPTNLKVN